MVERVELTPGFFVMRETSVPEVVLTPVQDSKVEAIASDLSLEEILHTRIKDLACEFNDLSGSIGSMERASKYVPFSQYDLQRLANKKVKLEEVRASIASIRTEMALIAEAKEAEFNKAQEERRLLKQKKSKEQAMRQAERVRKDNAAKAQSGKKKG